MRDTSPDYYHDLFSTCEILPEWKASAAAAMDKVFALRHTYYDLGRCWIIVAAVHWRECDCSPNSNLVNGEPWNKITILTPSAQGPWPDLRSCLLANVQWGETQLGNRLASLRDIEAWNGFGYAMIGKHSPYLWSGSQHGVGAGKFVEFLKDGRPHSEWKNIQDQQIGAAVLIREYVNRLQDVRGPGIVAPDAIA